MLTTIQVERSDIEKLQIIARKNRKPIEQVFHEVIESYIIINEEDPEEEAVNAALRSPKVRKAVSSLNKTLDSLNL